MKTKEDTLKVITEQALLPLFFYEDADVSLEVVRTLYRAGVRVIEYTNRGAAALENFRTLIAAANREMPELHLGIGTIKNVKQAADFIDAGAHFIVCPVVDLQIGKLVHEAGLLWIPGCFSPTEINLASQNGAGLIKLFPANLLGPAFMSSIKDLFPGQLFIPTGGVEIEAENISNWFKSGVCGVGMGSKLISKDILVNKEYDTLFTLTEKTFKIISETRLN
jgi:2-dehydro-3-deoxyphosphogluconate aldolase/(4S)-4-hydroxy-2-oxoglutarate aldolase